MNEGYIKLYRKAIDNGWLKNHELWAFWCWCLLKASHKNCVIMVGYQRVELKPGQFIFGRKKASEELNLSERKIRTCCSTLQNLQNMTIKTTNKFSIVSLVNWDTYQVDNLQNDQQTANKRPTNDQQTTTNKNDKNVKNDKNKKRTPLPPKGDNGFDSFWQSYPRHDAKATALKAWIKLNPSSELIVTILQSLEKQKQSLQWLKDNGQFIPMPATWLNQQRWEDEGPQIKDWREW